MSVRFGISLLKITHIPTGLSVFSDTSQHKTLLKVREICTKWLKNRLIAKQIGIVESDEVVASYDLPDDDLWPMELEYYREPIGGLAK